MKTGAVRTPPRQAICAGAFVVRSGRVLLLRRSSVAPVLPGWWEIPSGHVQGPETVREALLRELAEETGLVARIERQATILEYWIGRGAQRTHYVQVNYICSSPDDVLVQVSEEHDAFDWVEIGSCGIGFVSAELSESWKEAIDLLQSAGGNRK